MCACVGGVCIYFDGKRNFFFVLQNVTRFCFEKFDVIRLGCFFFLLLFFSMLIGCFEFGTFATGGGFRNNVFTSVIINEIRLVFELSDSIKNYDKWIIDYIFDVISKKLIPSGTEVLVFLIKKK